MVNDRQPSIPFWRSRVVAALAVITLLLGSSCLDQAEVQRAKGSLYDAEFAIVYDAVIKGVRKSYSGFREDAGKGSVHTSWHQVRFQNQSEDPRAAQLSATTQGLNNGTGQGGTGQGGTGMAAAPRGVYKRFFVRFDVSVLGGRPWRVRVVGHASEWEPGMAIPTELRGAAVPAWLPGRVDSLTVEIYRRLKKVAVKDAGVTSSVFVEEPKKTDASKFTSVPPAAATTLASILDVLNVRAYDALRALLDDQAVWSLGAGPSGDTALAMWQADPTVLDAMHKVIDAGCGASGNGDVVCPAAASNPAFVDWRLTLSARSGTWKIAAFVQGR
ncbi:MAG: hypothetical protein KBG15_13745 [Kofleriaceae bacterium]|nr:hypothetical protein [Kofleriaceae bacterium]